MAPSSKFLHALSVFISLASIVPVTWAGSVTHHAPEFISPEWKEVGKAAPASLVNFTIYLKSDYNKLTERMEAIAAEHSSWLSDDELAAYVAPSPEAIAAVEAAIGEMDATESARSLAGDAITISASVEKVSKVSIGFILLLRLIMINGRLTVDS